jgi:hypothetical protein
MPRKPPRSVGSGKKAPGKPKAAPAKAPEGARRRVPPKVAKAAPAPPSPPPKAKAAPPGKVRVPPRGKAAPTPPAAEAKAPATAQKVVGKAPKAKAASARGTRKAAAGRPPARLKIVWAVCDHTLKVLKTFPYPERRAAEAEAERLQKSKGKEHLVRPERVPMTD